MAQASINSISGMKSDAHCQVYISELLNSGSPSSFLFVCLAVLQLSCGLCTISNNKRPCLMPKGQHSDLYIIDHLLTHQKTLRAQNPLHGEPNKQTVFPQRDSVSLFLSEGSELWTDRRSLYFANVLHTQEVLGHSGTAP